MIFDIALGIVFAVIILVALPIVILLIGALIIIIHDMLSDLKKWLKNKKLK